MDVLLDIDPEFLKTLFEQDSAENSGEKTDDAFLQTVLRLFRIEAGQEKLGFLYPHLKRELIYDLITGPQGNIFVQNVVKIQQAGDIYYTNQWIRQNYKNSFSVADLAGQRNMSVSSFHQKFKSAIGMGPLQCQKKLRLIEARKLMLDGNCNVTKAATEVGYDSLSQFNRDYRKLFGASPQKDMQKIKTCIQKEQ